MKRFLVTGGAGFIGRHLVSHLLETACHVRVLDNFLSGSRECFPDSVDVVEGDAADSQVVAKCLREIDGVFHLAAIPSVKIAQEDPLLVMRSGEMSLVNVLQESLKNHSVKRLVFASSAAVYGNPQFLPITEEHPTNPISNYGVGKLACEHYLRAACAIQQSLDTVSLRFFNVFGPGQRDESSYSGVITKFLCAIKSGRQPIIYGDGKQTRDFIPVKAVAMACSDSMHFKKQFNGLAINVGSGNGISLNNLVRLIENIIQQTLNPIHQKSISSDIKYSYSSNKLLLRISNKIRKINTKKELIKYLENEKKINI